MAQINFNDVDFSSSNNGGYAVEFFNLKNDNDEAIVRIMHDSVNDFEILTTHEVKEDGKYRGRVNCIRNPKDDLNRCPLCASGAPVTQRMYIHLIHYVPDENGNIVPKAKIWERNVFYANQIKSYIDNYGPMSDIICKIVRKGKPHDQKTRYDIIPNLNKQVYRDDIYVKDTSLFENYRTLGTTVQDRSYDDLMTYVQTGYMPKKQNNPVPNSIPSGQNEYQSTGYHPNVYVDTTTAPVSQPVYTPVDNTVSQPVYHPNQTVTVNKQPVYVDTTIPGQNTQMERPVRSYY